MDKSIVNEVVSGLEAVKSYGQPGFWILLSILIVLVLVIAAVMYQRIVIKRFQTASKATQENFETIAADLRKRALEVKKKDDGLRKRDGSVAIGVGVEHRLKTRLQITTGDFLGDAICNRRYSQRAHAAVCFRNLHSSHRRRKVAP